MVKKKAACFAAALTVVGGIGFLLPTGLAWADEEASVGTCEEFLTALGDDSTVVKLANDIVGCATTATISKGKIIDGNGKSIIFTSNDGIHIETNDMVELNNLTVTASQRGITVPQNSGATTSKIVLDNVTINALYRGFSYFEGQNGASLVIKDSVIQNSGVTNYDEDWSSADGSSGTRGINFVEFTNSTASIVDTVVQGFKYVVNMTAYSHEGSTFDFERVNLKGWGDFNFWQKNASIIVSNSHLLGINKSTTSGHQNDFGNIKVNNGATGNTIVFNNVHLANAYVQNAIGEGETVRQAMLVGTGANSGNNISFNDCDFSDALSGRLNYGPIMYMWNDSVAVNSGVYDLSIDEDYLGKGKVNYLVDGRYVVDNAPDPASASQVLSRQIATKVGDYVVEGLADDKIAQHYATMRVIDDGVVGTDPLSDDAGRIVGFKATGTGSGRFEVDFPIYMSGLYYDDDSQTTYSQHVYPVDDYDRIMLYNIYDDETEASINSEALDHIASLIESSEDSDEVLVLDGNAEIDGTMYNGAQLAGKVLEMGYSIKTELVTEEISHDEYSRVEGYNEILSALKDDENIGAIYDGKVLLIALQGGDRYNLGQMHQLNSPVTLRMVIPEEILTPANGYKRTFYVIRSHKDENGDIVVDRLDATVDGNEISTKTDKFSNFAITYVDELDAAAATPDTGTMTTVGASASAAAIVTAVVVGLLTSIATFTYLMRRRG